MGQYVEDPRVLPYHLRITHPEALQRALDGFRKQATIAGLDPGLVTLQTIDRKRLDSSIRTHTRDIRHERWPKGPHQTKVKRFLPLSLPCFQACQATPSGPGSSLLMSVNPPPALELKELDRPELPCKPHAKFHNMHSPVHSFR